MSHYEEWATLCREVKQLKGCPKCGSTQRCSELNPRDLNWVVTTCQCGHVHLRRIK